MITKEQAHEICYLIDEWYLYWKNRLVDDGQTHSLGYAKEQLKSMICETEK